MDEVFDNIEDGLFFGEDINQVLQLFDEGLSSRDIGNFEESISADRLASVESSEVSMKVALYTFRLLMTPPLLRGMVNIQEGVSRWFQNNIGVKSFWGVMLSELGLVHFSEPLDNDEIETAQSLVRMFDEIYTPCLESNSLLKLVSVLKAVTDTLGETARCALKVKRLMIHNISVILLLMKLLMVKKRTFSKPNFIQKLVVASQALIDKCMLMVLSKNESDEEVISRFQEALSSQANTHLNDVLPWNESEQQGKEYFMEFCIYLFITKLLINQKSYSPKKLDYLDLGTPINVKQRPSVTRNLAYSHLNRNRRNLCRARSL